MVLGWIVFGLVAVLTTYLVIDFIFWLIRRIKAKNVEKTQINDTDKVE